MARPPLQIGFDRWSFGKAMIWNDAIHAAHVIAATDIALFGAFCLEKSLILWCLISRGESSQLPSGSLSVSFLFRASVSLIQAGSTTSVPFAPRSMFEPKSSLSRTLVLWKHKVLNTNFRQKYLKALWADSCCCWKIETNILVQCSGLSSSCDVCPEVLPEIISFRQVLSRLCLQFSLKSNCKAYS